MNVALDAPKRPALRYYGGKFKLAPWIISHFPEHKNYVEPCCGACSVLLQKPRSPLETVNDLDGNVVNFFRVLRDKPDELIRKIKLTPWARAEYELSLTPAGDDVEQARQLFVRAWMGRGAICECTGWRYDRYECRFVANDMINAALDSVAARLMGVQIENRNALDVIRDFDCVGALIYFDPPYVNETRSHKTEYVIDQFDDFHHAAAELLYKCAGYVVVSGYACSLYADLYERHDWQRVDMMAQTNSDNKRVESLWLSPRTVDALARPAQAGLFA